MFANISCLHEIYSSEVLLTWWVTRVMWPKKVHEFFGEKSQNGEFTTNWNFEFVARFRIFEFCFINLYLNTTNGAVCHMAYSQ